MVLLCVRNGAPTLDRQLAALCAQDYHDSWELVVVDNGSTDTTREIATGWVERMPGLRIVEEAHVGVNRARNRGVLEGGASLVVCCDADDQVSPGWLRAMVHALEQFDVVGGAIDPEHLSRPNTPRVACLQTAELPAAFGMLFAVGANFGFKRAVFDAVGGFDDTFPLGSDEIDFCLRAQHAGFSIGFVPAAVIHYQLKTTARSVMRQRFAYGRGHEHLTEKLARLGYIQSRLTQRWKIIIVGTLRLLRHLPELMVRESRLQFLASVAHLSGRFVELCRESVEAISPRRSPGLGV
jgi:GT2 family glycosyltransferase